MVIEGGVKQETYVNSLSFMLYRYTRVKEGPVLDMVGYMHSVRLMKPINHYSPLKGILLAYWGSLVALVMHVNSRRFSFLKAIGTA